MDEKDVKIDPSHELPEPEGMRPDHELPPSTSSTGHEMPASTSRSEPSSTPSQPNPNESFGEQHIPSKSSFESHPALKWLIIIFLIVALIGVLYYFFSDSMNNEEQTVSTTPTPQVTVAPSIAPTNDWKTYSNPDYNFSFQYPPDWTVTETTKQNVYQISLGPTSNPTISPSPGFQSSPITIYVTKTDFLNSGIGTPFENGLESYPLLTDLDAKQGTTTLGQYIVFTHDGNYYTIVPDGSSESTSNLDAILSTFTFTDPAEPVGFCTMDARVCPDGTAVGRIPPTCDFAPCPRN